VGTLRAIEFTGTSLKLLDQTKLPHEIVWHEYHRADEVADAIVRMIVRGAPAIATAAAYGLALEATYLAEHKPDEITQELRRALERMAKTRPTAVNLFWAINRLSRLLDKIADTPATSIRDAFISEAERIAVEDVETNRRIGRHGAGLFQRPVQILTHCNTGSLATVEYGTALGVIRALHEVKLLDHVWVDETRPYLQGARLTAFELSMEGIPHTLITDNMAGHFMKLGKVDAVIVGADRVAANGDVANKIGTYSLAVLCHYHNIPFYVAAPLSTFDLHTPDGTHIPIEERSTREVVTIGATDIAPKGTNAAHPAFDVTPHELISAIITEQGVIHNPDEKSVKEVVSKFVTT
jgi:methylthioribose-1-phosphate isomerase